MLSMQESIDVHGDFQILSFENSLLILYLLKKYVFNFSVYEILGITYENCCIILCWFHLVRSLKGGAHRYTSHIPC